MTRSVTTGNQQDIHGENFIVRELFYSRLRRVAGYRLHLPSASYRLLFLRCRLYSIFTIRLSVTPSQYELKPLKKHLKKRTFNTSFFIPEVEERTIQLCILIFNFLKSNLLSLHIGFIAYICTLIKRSFFECSKQTE